MVNSFIDGQKAVLHCGTECNVIQPKSLVNLFIDGQRAVSHCGIE